MKAVIDTTGCCPASKLVCDKSLCPPKPTQCTEAFYVVEKTKSADDKICCDTYECRKLSIQFLIGFAMLYQFSDTFGCALLGRLVGELTVIFWRWDVCGFELWDGKKDGKVTVDSLEDNEGIFGKEIENLLRFSSCRIKVSNRHADIKEQELLFCTDFPLGKCREVCQI